MKPYKDIYVVALNAAIEAGKAIMQVYNDTIKVDIKSDGSPITLADQRANKIIVAALAQTQIPVISEELPLPTYAERSEWEQFWLVDPLDGTKEFVNRNGEFTVNIALIRRNRPVFGIVTAPAHNYGYVGSEGQGAFKILDISAYNFHKNNRFEEIISGFQKLRPLVPNDKPILAASRSHTDAGNQKIIEDLFGKNAAIQTIHRGSALKFGLVAEGTAHYYLRNDKIWEWDTAAGHAVLLAAGGWLLTWPQAQELTYNKESLRNPGFVACSDKNSLALLQSKFPF